MSMCPHFWVTMYINIPDFAVVSELNLNGVLLQQNTTVQFYSELMRKLERMNSTLGYMLTYLDSMQSRLEDRLHMIQGYLGWAGTKFNLEHVEICIL